MLSRTTIIAVAALLLCSGCADQPTKTTALINPAGQQVAAIHWDEVSAATSAAQVSNGKLIFMR